ncbi:hypothetical protein [Brachyspira innocens]|uniref:Uncharacterized protein n=1 Tax=Brachyspira innocens TaxID=13264 RepID=A0ABT8YX52_9SPIR|nr:hypothetical protein [Brachyspira innocens]MDO7019802.1 hypothetical protein [Brachyspira innocens]
MKWYEKYPEVFREVLSKVFDEKFFYEYDNNKYFLEDKNVSVNIEVFNKSLAIKTLEGNKLFPYLKNQKCADKVIIQETVSRLYDMHIFEFSIAYKNDKKLAEQLEGACLRALAVFSYFKSIKINKIYLYFVINEMTNPLIMKKDLSNKRIEKDIYKKDFLIVKNYSNIFKEKKLKIKLLEHNQRYSIKYHSNEYGLKLSFL